MKTIQVEDAVAMRMLEGQMSKELKAKEQKTIQKKVNDLEQTIQECKHEINSIKQTQNV